MTPARPDLCVSPLDTSVTHEAWQLVAAASPRFPLLYRSAGIPVLIQTLEEGGTITKPVTPAEFRTILDRLMACYRPVGKDQTPKPCYPPPDLVTMMLHDPVSPLPALRRIVTVPVFDTKGRLRTEAGYQADDGLLVLPDATVRPVPAAPTPADLTEARRLILDELLCDFPFASDGDRTAAVAMMLLPFVRDLIAGPTPLHFVEAPTPGSGKSLLARACLIAGLGDRGCNWISFPEEDDELRKQITTLLLENRGAVLWDNLGRFLKSATLAKLLTDLEWSDRRLGASQGVSIPVRTLWLMTGNNPQMSDEMVRRVVPIRLVPDLERPEERRSFRHDDLIQWATQHRADLIWAAHVVVTAWLAHRPEPSATTPPFGSFEAYRRVMGGILDHAGFHGFLTNRQRLQAFSDPDGEHWRHFMAEWRLRFGGAEVKCLDLLPLAEEAEIDLRGQTEKARANALGTQLGLRRERLFDGVKIESGIGRARRMWRATLFEGPELFAGETNGNGNGSH